MISALESKLDLNIGIVYIHEPFLGKTNLVHARFNLY